jgi:hypothetical protein
MVEKQGEEEVVVEPCLLAVVKLAIQQRIRRVQMAIVELGLVEVDESLLQSPSDILEEEVLGPLHLQLPRSDGRIFHFLGEESSFSNS